MPRLISEIPQSIGALRKAQDEYRSALAWLKIARKNADDVEVTRQIEDAEEVTKSLSQELDRLQRSIKTSNTKTKSNKVVKGFISRLQ